MPLDISQFQIEQQLLVEQARSAYPIEWHPQLPDHLSPSSISMFRRCPRQYQERYLHGRKERPAEAPVIGTAVHAGLEHNFAQKITSHEDLPAVELLTWFGDVGWPITLELEQAKAGEEVFWDSKPEQAKVRGAKMLAEYRETVAPRIQPTGIEGKVEVDFHAPVPVVGRFDIERETGVIDVKTGRKAKRKPQESWRIQAAVYGEATGKPVEFHSLSASPERGSVTIVTPLESEELLIAPGANERAVLRENVRLVAAEIALYMNLLGPDQTWPTYGRFHDWACGFCGFRNDCPAWSDE